MARARNIKPGFFKNEDLAELAYEYRLLFIGLWTMADREGYLEDRPKRIKMELFPADNVDVETGLAQLQKLGFIYRYTVGESRFMCVCNFLEHQYPHHLEKPSTIPKPECNPPDILNPDVLNPESLFAAKPAKRKSQLPDDFFPDETGVNKATEAGILVDQELERFRDFHKGRGSTMLDWQAAWRTWVGNAVKFAARSPPKSDRVSDRASKVAEFIGKRERVING